MQRPKLRVDFNEMLEQNLVLLSKDDFKLDFDGKVVKLTQGLMINIYNEDTDDFGHPNYLFASGVVELNNHKGWSSHVRWCCRIDESGIYHVSKLPF